MVGRLYGGTERMRSKYGDIVPGNFEMAVYAQNAVDQFTDPALTALNSEDAMERYQLQVMKTSTPEIRVPMGEDKGISGRKRAHDLITTLFQGGPRGPPEQAYKPEIVQSNKSVYTYAVPSTDPVIASRDRNGTYHSDVSGRTIYRMSLPNNPSNKEIGTRMFNTQNRFAKYAAAKSQRLENTSQIVDWIPQHKDNMWESRAIDTYRNRLMPRIEDIDNGDNVNREKNRCRDVQKVAYRYRHKEYDTDRELHEVLDNNTRVLPEVTPRQGDGTSIGELAAELAKRGYANQNTGPDIAAAVQRAKKRLTNPNANKSKHTKVFDNGLPNGDDKDGERNFNRQSQVKSEAIRIFGGLNNIKKEILMGNVLDEINKTSKKKIRPRRKDTKNKNTTFDSDTHIRDDDVDGKPNDVRQGDVKDEDLDRDVLSFNIPILIDRFKDEIAIVRHNPKVAKKGSKKNNTTNDHPYELDEDNDNESVNREFVNDVKTSVHQNVRGLIKDMIPDDILEAKNQKINPNKKLYKGVNMNFDTLPDNDTTSADNRAPMFVGDAMKRPILPVGVVLDEQIEFDGKRKKVNKKRKQADQLRDDGLF